MPRLHGGLCGLATNNRKMAILLIAFVLVILLSAFRLHPSNWSYGLLSQSQKGRLPRGGQKMSATPVRNGASFVLEGQDFADKRVDPSIPEGVTFSAASNKKRFGENGGDEAILLEYQYMDLVYTWVNGSEPSQRFMKLKRFGYLEADSWKPGKGETLMSLLDRVVTPNSRDRESGELLASFRSVEKFLQWHKGRIILVTPGYIPTWIDPLHLFLSEGDSDDSYFKKLFQKISSPLTGKKIDDGSDVTAEEIAFYKTVVDRVKGRVGMRRRVIVVHQDTIVPYEQRQTSNSNSIEPQIYKLPGLSPIFIQMNDDYIVMKKTSVRTFVNEAGGPNLLFESNIIRGGKLQTSNPTMSPWLCSVFNTNSLIQRVVDDYVGPHNVFLKKFGKVTKAKSPFALVEGNLTLRWFVKHAPFVYSRNLLRWIASNASGILDQILDVDSIRHCDDVLIPFLHHALAMDRPWIGHKAFLQMPVDIVGDITNQDDSPTTTPTKRQHGIPSSAVSKKYRKLFGGGGKTTVEIPLDAETSCPPATSLIGDPASAQYLLLTDDTIANEKHFSKMTNTFNAKDSSQKATFYAVNDGFTKDSVATALSQQLFSLFPDPMPMELAHSNSLSRKEKSPWFVFPNVVDHLSSQPAEDGDPAPSTLSLVTVFFVLDDIEYLCASLRSLRLALPTFAGKVQFFILPTTDSSSPQLAAQSEVNLRKNPRRLHTLALEEMAGWGAAENNDDDDKKKKDEKDKDQPYRRTGVESKEASNWLPICHLNEERVSIEFLSPEDVQGWTPTSTTTTSRGPAGHVPDELLTKMWSRLQQRRRDAAARQKKKNNKRGDREDVSDIYMTVDQISAVFGQTLALEDFVPIGVPTMHLPHADPLLVQKQDTSWLLVARTYSTGQGAEDKKLNSKKEPQESGNGGGSEDVTWMSGRIAMITAPSGPQALNSFLLPHLPFEHDFVSSS